MFCYDLYCLGFFCEYYKQKKKKFFFECTYSFDEVSHNCLILLLTNGIENNENKILNSINHFVCSFARLIQFINYVSRIKCESHCEHACEQVKFIYENKSINKKKTKTR